jgi:hypothetical protein
MIQHTQHRDGRPLIYGDKVPLDEFRAYCERLGDNGLVVRGSPFTEIHVDPTSGEPFATSFVNFVTADGGL